MASPGNDVQDHGPEKGARRHIPGGHEDHACIFVHGYILSHFRRMCQSRMKKEGGGPPCVTFPVLPAFYRRAVRAPQTPETIQGGSNQ